MRLVLRVPTEGVEDEHQDFENACDVLVRWLLVLGLFGDLAGWHEIIYNVVNYSQCSFRPWCAGLCLMAIIAVFR